MYMYSKCEWDILFNGKFHGSPISTYKVLPYCTCALTPKFDPTVAFKGRRVCIVIFMNTVIAADNYTYHE